MPTPDDADVPPGAARGAAATPRPESLLLALFGARVRGRDAAVGVASVIEVLRRAGVGEHATRAVLKRMTQRGLLRNVHLGRRAYVSLTPHAEAILRDGAERLDAPVINRHWDGHWTLLVFSVPESRRGDRHALRTRLGWAGFGSLHNGVWIAPSPGRLDAALAELGLLGYVKTFRAAAVTPDDPRALVAEAWDLSGLARSYQLFVRRWSSPDRSRLDDLSQQILLEAQWLLLIREDPRLPLSLLPGNWPGIAAEDLFRSLRRRLDEPARALADALLDWLPHAKRPGASRPGASPQPPRRASAN